MNRFTRLAPFVLLAVSLPLTAFGSVKKEGAWPASDKKVSFEFEGKPSEGLSKLASEAGWSLVMSKGIAVGEHDVKIDVDDQPADAVLDALFADSKVVARRNGTLVSITRDEGATPDVAPAIPAVPATPAAPIIPTPPVLPAAPPADLPSPPPVPTVRGEDRNVLGSSIEIGENEIVHTVTVTGGSAKVRGTVTGDIVVAGGSVKLESGSRVIGNATVFGGALKVERGARIDGDVGVVGGALKREEGAIIGGKVVDQGKGTVGVHVDDSGNVSTKVDEGKKKGSSHHHGRTSSGSAFTDYMNELGQSVTRMSLLFVLGCIALALGNRRMEALRLETAARPMRSFAMGIVGALGALVTLTAACITIVGIPFAAVAVIAGVLAVYASMCAVLTTFGAAVLGHRTKNPYVHLLFGCVAFFLTGLVPFVGGLVTAFVTLVSIGVLVATRLGGLAAMKRVKPDLV